MLHDEIRQFIRSKKYLGFTRVEIYNEAVLRFGRENESIITFAIQDEYEKISGPQNFERKVQTNFAGLSLGFGILSIFIAGIIFGPVALYFGMKAKENGENSTPGIVCGMIGLICAVIIIFLMVMWGS